MGELAGKNGLIVGVANKRSLAWAIARAADEAGARLTLSYASERFESNARKLADTLTAPPQLAACDVTDDAAIAELCRQVEEAHGGLDFLVHAVAFASREAISEPFLRTSRADFAQSLDISAYSLVALAREAAPLMEHRGGGAIVTLTYLGSDRVFPHYNVMGVAKAALEATVRLPGERSRALGTSASTPFPPDPSRRWPRRASRSSAGILQHYRESAPLGRTVDADEVAAAARFLLGPGGRGVTGEVLMVDGGYHATGM